MTTPQRKPQLKSQVRQQPITAHRLFPAIVGLWVAALFGLGSFAVPPQLLEGAVTAIGLPAIVPATAPPLGFTARALVALVLTVLGAIIGLVVGRSLRSERAPRARRRFGAAVTREADGLAPKVRARDAHPDAPPRKPLTLSEDIVATQSVAEPALRRRALSITDESLPFDPVEGAPLPGHDPWAKADASELDAPKLGANAFDVEALVEAESASEFVDVLELPAQFLVESPERVSFTSYEAADDSSDIVQANPEIENLEIEVGEAMVAAPAVAVAPPFAGPLVAAGYRQVEAPVAPASLVRSPVAGAPLESLGLVQLIERLAVAMAERRAKQDALLAAGLVPAPPADVLPTPPESPRVDEVEAPSVPFQQPDTAMIVPAIARLTRSEEALQPAAAPIELDRVVSLRPLGLGSIGQVGEAGVDADNVDSADWASEDWASDAWDNGSAAIPRFLSISEIQPTTSHAQLADRQAQDPLDADTNASTEELYSSLLDITPPSMRQEFVGIDDRDSKSSEIEPVVIFPGQGPRAGAPFDRPSASAPVSLAGGARSGASPAPTAPAAPSTLPDANEADRALRAALATLQRMTAKG